MKSRTGLFGALCVYVTIAAAGPAGAQSGGGGNHISGDGLPSPAPVVTQNWGNLPEGREWGSTAGVDIDPTDGHI